MDADTIIKRLKRHKEATHAETIGVIGSYGKVAEIDDDGDKNDIIAIANTGDIDLDDEVVVPSGLTTEYLMKNRQIFVDHEYGIHNAAGHIRSIAKYPSPQDHKSWRVRIGLYDNDAGRAVKEIAKRSGQIGLSIGFFPTDYGPPTEDELNQYGRDGKKLVSVVRAGRMFEISFTALPCNVSCQGSLSIGDAKGLADAADAAVRDGAIERRTATLLGFAEPVRTQKVLTPHGMVTRKVGG